MIRISAKYIFDLPVHFLIKGEPDSKTTSWCFDIDGSKVEMVVFHQKDGSVRAQGESLHTFSAMHAEITVSREYENLPIEGTAEWEKFFWAAEEEYTQIAKIALNRVIRYFKYRLGNPLLNDLSFTEDHLFYNPKWFKETGEELDSGIHNYYGQHSPALSFYNSLGIKSYSLGDEPELLSAVKNLIEPSLVEQFLSDAKTSIMNENIRRAVLEMAIACEIFVKGSFFRSNAISSSVFDYLESKRKVEISTIELLHGVARYTFGESFKEHSEQHYKNIDYLFRTRNKVAHTGQCEYRDEKGLVRKVYEDDLVEWWSSVEEMIAWLNTHCSVNNQ